MILKFAKKKTEFRPRDRIVKQTKMIVVVIVIQVAKENLALRDEVYHRGKIETGRETVTDHETDLAIVIAGNLFKQ